MGQSVEGQSILELIVILYLHRTSWAIYIFLAVSSDEIQNMKMSTWKSIGRICVRSNYSNNNNKIENSREN